MTLQELERIKVLALSPDATMWDLRETLCRVAVEHEWLMHTHAALREDVEKSRITSLSDVNQRITGSGNELAAPSGVSGAGVTSAPMKAQIYTLVRRLTRWAA